MTYQEYATFNENTVYDIFDITTALMRFIEEGDEKTEHALAEAVYAIEQYAKNEYNFDYWRVLYNVLVEIAGRA